MARWFATPRSFGDKVSWLVTLTSAVAIVGVSFFLATANHLDLQRAAFDSLEAQSSIVAMNSGAPMVFGDRGSATEALNAFRAMPSVASATLYRSDGTQFASYHRAASTSEPAYLRTSDKQITSTTGVKEKGQSLGRLEVAYDLSALRRHLWQSLALAAVISLAAMTLVYLFSRRITRVIMRPIDDLGSLARRISQSKDYSLRARKISDDEMGAFTDTFNDMLAQIQRQDIDLKNSREEAEIASRMKDEFLATLSHELRTPMTPIVGWAQILRRLVGDDPRVLQAAEVIERNALVQTRIIDDLLDMSRIISGKMRLEMTSFAIGDVVDAALDTVRDAARAKGIALETRIGANVPALLGDAHRIQQVLWNLLSNAIKFTVQGGSVRILARRSDGHVEIAISDTGKGIAAEFLPYVFERFRQADSSITRAHGGLGLGLAIVKQLVELHGGTVEVASAGPDQGSTFTVLLPIRKGAIKAAMASPMRSRLGPAGAADAHLLEDLKLAIIDDEADTRDLIEHLLRSRGAQVFVWRSASEALTHIEETSPDVLICDIGMPDMDGYAFMRELRRSPGALGAIPAIALTAFARAEDRRRALGAGYQIHLGKPVDEAELVAAAASLASPRRVGETLSRHGPATETSAGA